MSQQMLNFSEIKWNEIVDVDESPIAFCYRKDIPAYFRVDKYRQLVRYEYRLRAGIHHFVFSPVEKFSLQSPPWKSSLGIIFMEYPVEDFHEDIRFLRIEQSSLRLIANEGGAVISKFSRVGFSTTGPTRNSPIALCYRKDIPAYFRVDKYRQLFRYEYRLRAVIYHFVFSPVEKFSLQSPPWKSYLEILFMGYPVEDFYEDIRFLRLEQSSLRLIANEGGAVISTFSSVGLSTTGPTRNVGGNTKWAILQSARKQRGPRYGEV
jgi:hypothetical protein